MLLVAVLLSVMILPASQAMAYPTDSAGNAFSSASSIADDQIPSDLIWLGIELDMDSTEVGGDILAAGSTILVSDSTVGGDVRIAGSKVTVNSTAVTGNVTAIAQNMMVGQGTVANGVILMGSNIGFYGTANALDISGSTVVLDGVVDGDVTITAQNVTVGAGTVISGKLTVTSENEPIIQDGAQLGDYEHLADSSIFSAFPMMVSIAGAAGLMMVLTMLLMLVVVALLLTLLMRREIGLAATMTREHPVRLVLVGLLTFFLFPIALLMFVMLLATAWAAFAGMALLVLLTIIAIPFTGCAMGRLAFRNMNPFLSAVVGAVIVFVLSMFPFIGFPIMLMCSVYTAGYFVCTAASRVSANISGRSEGQGEAGSQGQGV